jgi:molybdenum cofactor cytidylyltransferase
MIAGVVLAAGLSRRMGMSKMSLPWGSTTVLGHVIETLFSSGLSDIIVVTGGYRDDVQRAVQGLPARIVHNAEYEGGEMLSSFQLGLTSLGEEVDAALLVLGDQPQIESWVVHGMVDLYREKKPYLILPSYQKRRGHPWLVDRKLWPVVMELAPPFTLRDFLNQNASKITYLEVNTDTILQDLDTLDDYHRSHPNKP